MQADHHINLQKQKFAADFLHQLMFLSRKLFINNCCIYLTTEYQLKTNSKLLLKKRSN